VSMESRDVQLFTIGVASGISSVARNNQPEHLYVWGTATNEGTSPIFRAICRAVVRDWLCEYKAPAFLNSATAIAALLIGNFSDHSLVFLPGIYAPRSDNYHGRTGALKFVMEMIDSARDLSLQDLHDFLAGDGSNARLLYFVLAICMPLASLFILIRIYTQLCVVGKFELEDCRLVPNILFESY
jgi:hypothetical protein